MLTRPGHHRRMRKRIFDNAYETRATHPGQAAGVAVHQVIMISIIIPVLNEERALPATLAQVFAQAGDYEVIVVDGGSTDNTRGLIENESRVRLLSARAGRAAGLNLKPASFTLERGDAEVDLGVEQTVRHGCSPDGRVESDLGAGRRIVPEREPDIGGAVDRHATYCKSALVVESPINRRGRGDDVETRHHRKH